MINSLLSSAEDCVLEEPYSGDKAGSEQQYCELLRAIAWTMELLSQHLHCTYGQECSCGDRQENSLCQIAEVRNDPPKTDSKGVQGSLAYN